MKLPVKQIGYRTVTPRTNTTWTFTPGFIPPGQIPPLQVHIQCGDFSGDVCPGGICPATKLTAYPSRIHTSFAFLRFRPTLPIPSWYPRELPLPLSLPSSSPLFASLFRGKHLIFLPPRHSLCCRFVKCALHIAQIRKCTVIFDLIPKWVPFQSETTRKYLRPVL